MKDFVKRPISLWLCVALALFALAIQGGCGGCKSPDQRRKAMIEAAEEAARKEAAEDKEAQEVLLKKAAARKEEQEKRKAAQKELEAARKKQQEDEKEQSRLPELPAELGQWNEEHFLQALATGNPQLIKALEHKAKAPQRTAEEAKLLTSLLAPPPQANKPSVHPISNQPRRHVTYASIDRGTLVRAVAAALAANGTAEARETLAQLLGSHAEADQRDAAAEGAVAVLMRNGSAEGEQLVFQAITAPVELANMSTASGGARTAFDSARQRMIALVGAQASRKLRVDLARWAVEEAAPGPVRDAVVKMLCEPNWLNLDAQMLLYGSPVCDAAARTALERQMLLLSGEALGSLLGLPSEETAADSLQRTGRSQTTVPISGSLIEKHYVVARNLWHPRFAELLDLQIQAASSTEAAATLVNLAATIPTSAMRERLRRTLHRQWWEGPQILSGRGEGRGLTEPGLLPVLKWLHRQNGVGSSSGGRPGRSGGNARNPGAAGRGSAQPAERSAAAGEAWNRYLEGMVRNFCRRCHLAALQQAAAAQRSSGGASPELDLEHIGFPQFPGAHVQAVFNIDFPGMHATELPDLADEVLRLRYVRLEVVGKPSGTAAYYRRQLTQCLERPWPDGLWLDSLRSLSENSITRSVDAIITLPKGIANAYSDNLPMTVEVLVIDIPEYGFGQVKSK